MSEKKYHNIFVGSYEMILLLMFIGNDLPLESLHFLQSQTIVTRNGTNEYIWHAATLKRLQEVSVWRNGCSMFMRDIMLESNNRVPSIIKMSAFDTLVNYIAIASNETEVNVSKKRKFLVN